MSTEAILNCNAYTQFTCFFFLLSDFIISACQSLRLTLSDILSRIGASCWNPLVTVCTSAVITDFNGVVVMHLLLFIILYFFLFGNALGVIV